MPTERKLYWLVIIQGSDNDGRLYDITEWSDERRAAIEKWHTCSGSDYPGEGPSWELYKFFQEIDDDESTHDESSTLWYLGPMCQKPPLDLNGTMYWSLIYND